MALNIIGAGLGRTATFSLKFALEHLGFGPCYHMSEVFAGGRRNVPLWLDAVNIGTIGWGKDTVNYPMQEGTFFGNIIDTGPLSGTTGAVLDPVFALRVRVRVEPRHSAAVAFTTLVAPTRERASRACRHGGRRRA